MFQSPNEVEQTLQEMAAEVAAQAREGHVLRSESMPTMLFLTTPRGIATCAILDLAEHLAAIQEAIEVTEATGFLFVHDGWIHFDNTPTRIHAVLIVTAAREGATTGKAHPYEYLPVGGAVFAPPLDAPVPMLAPYEKLFCNSNS